MLLVPTNYQPNKLAPNLEEPRRGSPQSPPRESRSDLKNSNIVLVLIVVAASSLAADSSTATGSPKALAQSGEESEDTGTDKQTHKQTTTQISENCEEGMTRIAALRLLR